MNDKLEYEYEKNIEKMKGFIKPNFSIRISGLTEFLALIGAWFCASLPYGVLGFIVFCKYPAYSLEDTGFVDIFNWLHENKNDVILFSNNSFYYILNNVLIYAGYLGAILYDWVFVFIEIFLLYRFKKFYDALLPEYKLIKFDKMGLVFWTFVITVVIAYIGLITGSEIIGVFCAICLVVSLLLGSVFFVRLSKAWSQYKVIKHLSYIWCFYFIGQLIAFILGLLGMIDMVDGTIFKASLIVEIILSMIFYIYIEQKMCIAVYEKEIVVNSVKSVDQVQSITEDVKSEEVQADIEGSVEDEEDDEYDDENDDDLTEEEARYLEDVEFYLEEDGGVITPEARDILQRKCKRWGISEERANEIEQMCISSNAGYTNEEKEYIEIYQELSAHGEITERKRRMLERERESLGISEERAKELEENC
jgi:hypothetical protein